MDWVSDGIENLTSFMGAFCPLYFLAVSIARGSVTASAFYQAVLFLIYLVEMIIGKIVLEYPHLYYGKGSEFLSEEKYLNRLSELLEIAISWILKTVLALVVGLNIVQGLISPAVDMVKKEYAYKKCRGNPRNWGRNRRSHRGCTRYGSVSEEWNRNDRSDYLCLSLPDSDCRDRMHCADV